MKGIFRTRYHITPIDSATGQACGPTTTVDNMVLDTGYKALGEIIAFDRLSIGKGTNPVTPDQILLTEPLASIAIAECEFGQSISQAFRITSTASFEYTFKNIQFPSNVRTVNVTEIGLDRVTRAVFDPIEIERRHWLHVTVEVIYDYGMATKSSFKYVDYGLERDEEITVDVTTTPVVFNASPHNNAGRGWGAPNSVLCYLWNGNVDDYQDYNLAAAYGVIITPKLDHQNYRWSFAIRRDRVNTPIPLPGFIVRDTLNGGAYLIKLTQEGNVFYIPDDGELSFDIHFSWK